MRVLVRLVGLAVALALLVAGLAAAPSQSQPAASQLALHVTLSVVAERHAACPPGTPAYILCWAQTGQGAAPGLGIVAQTALQRIGDGPPSCPVGYYKALGYPARWVVANKGELDFALAEVPGCVDYTTNEIGAVERAFTVTGGTGIYAGASGSGLAQEAVTLGGDGQWRGTETWTGTLSVPGLDFDITAPVLAGAANKTVRAKKHAKSARVTFHVTAQDDRDGALPVSCHPRSGSRFRIGRTRVVCSATDNSANSQTARFTVTVKRRR
jgi:hypothetical protein